MKKTFLVTIITLFMISNCFASVNPNTSLLSLSGTKQVSPSIAVIISDFGKLKLYPKALVGVETKLESKLQLNGQQILLNNDVITHFNEFIEDKEFSDPNSIKRTHLVEFGRKYHYDYVVLLSFSENGVRRTTDSALVLKTKKYILSGDLVAKVVDVRDGSYIYRKNITKEAKSTTFTTFLPSAIEHEVGIILTPGVIIPANQRPSVVRAWNELVDLCIDQFAQDFQVILDEKM
jgi:hypothetical protein